MRQHVSFPTGTEEISNVLLGTLSISTGGIGTTTSTANQILIGNAAISIL
jgi:hypothetical protein